MPALSYDVFVSEPKPIAPDAVVWPHAAHATWPASTATLVLGERDAVLVDALLLEREARALVAWIAGHGRRLTTIYLTHGHGDHLFGAGPVLDAFPEARLVALPAVAAAAAAQIAGVRAWRARFPEPIAQRLVAPAALDRPVLDLEGHALALRVVGRGDTPDATVVHVPELALVLAGDVAYDMVHPWLAGADRAGRAEWRRSLEAIARLDADVVVAGHRGRDAPDAAAGRVLAEAMAYLDDFDALAARPGTARDLIDAMVARHPLSENLYALRAAAAAERSGPPAPAFP